jgi:hypothetical protein
MQQVHRINNIFLLPSENESEGFSLHVYGNTYTNGWSNMQLVPLFSERNADGIYEFSFVAIEPQSQPLPVTTAISASYIFSGSIENLKQVRVFAESNMMEASLEPLPVKAEARRKHQLFHAMKSLAYSIATGILPVIDANHSSKSPQTA